MLLDDTYLTEEKMTSFVAFVCAVYCKKGIQIRNITELRWHIFCKYMADSDKLPPTVGVLKHHIMRVHVQVRVWGQARQKV